MNESHYTQQTSFVSEPNCAVPKDIHTLSTEGTGATWEGRKDQKFQEMVLSLTEISREEVGGGGFLEKKSFHVGRDIDTFKDTTLNFVSTRVSTFSGT